MLKVRVRRTALLSVLGLAAACACGQTNGLPSPMHYPLASPHGFIKGMTEAAYQRRVLLEPRVYRSLDRLRIDGVDWMSLQVAWYQKNDTSNRIFADGRQTPTDASVTDFIHYLNGLGMRVFLDVFVNANHQNAWQAAFRPSKPKAWFHSYDTYLVHYAKLAQADHVNLFAIGDEFDRLDDVPRYEPYFAKAISDVRRYYHGPVTYGADYSHYQKVTFWKHLDVVGIDAYFPLSSAPKPPTSELQASWNHIANQLQSFRKSRGLSHKPLVITELGYYSGRGAAKTPGDWTSAAPVDLGLQRRLYEATFQTIYQRPWLSGIFWFWWANPSNPHWKGGAQDNGYTPRGKPAEAVLRYYFHRPHARPVPSL